jgi:hypothetical protein
MENAVAFRPGHHAGDESGSARRQQDTNRKVYGDPADPLIAIDTIDNGFKGNCPLWTYVLAETGKTSVTIKTTRGDKRIDTFQLGLVGGRIVAETFLGLMPGDSSSYLALNPLWKPNVSFTVRANSDSGN